MYCLRIDGSYVRKQNATTNSAAEKGSFERLTSEEYFARRPDLEDPDAWCISPKYQWLPTDFEVINSGDVKCLGYINNLHPTRYASLYPPITSILARFIPLFERVLSDTLSAEPELAIEVDPYGWYPEDLEEPDLEGPYTPEHDIYDEWERLHKWPVVPDPEPFKPQPDDERTTYSLKGRTLQVIVKLANIVLTPETPTYPGGAWHVEGMGNESIVATGLYYYACDNITESRLSFRTVVGTEESASDMPYEQSDNRGYSVVFGFANGNEQNQNLSHIVAEEDKCVAFPNIYQHHVDEFKLADPTKPGYRKILCFFLVNPNHRILSTTDVPPQQADWAIEELEKADALRKLPQELFDMVASHVREGTITREQAEADRDALMKERSEFVIEHNERVFELEFNMCEH